MPPAKHVTYLAPFSFTPAAPFTATVTEGVNVGNVSITGSFYTAFNVSDFYPVVGSVTLQGVIYEDFAQTLAYKLEQASFGGWAYKVSFDPGSPSGALGIAVDSGIGTAPTFTAGTVAKAVLGLTGTAHTVGMDVPTYTNVFPYYVWQSTQADRSDWTRGYEQKPVYIDSEADDGTVYSFGRSGVAVCSDWKHEKERMANVQGSAASALRPWTWEHFIEHTRTLPFLVFTGSLGVDSCVLSSSLDGGYAMRAEASHFKPMPLMANYHDFWTINVKTRRLTGSV